MSILSKNVLVYYEHILDDTTVVSSSGVVDYIKGSFRLDEMQVSLVIFL